MGGRQNRGICWTGAGEYRPGGEADSATHVVEACSRLRGTEGGTTADQEIRSFQDQNWYDPRGSSDIAGSTKFFIAKGRPCPGDVWDISAGCRNSSSGYR